MSKTTPTDNLTAKMLTTLRLLVECCEINTTGRYLVAEWHTLSELASGGGTTGSARALERRGLATIETLYFSEGATPTAAGRKLIAELDAPPDCAFCGDPCGGFTQHALDDDFCNESCLNEEISRRQRADPGGGW